MIYKRHFKCKTVWYWNIQRYILKSRYNKISNILSTAIVRWINSKEGFIITLVFKLKTPSSAIQVENIGHILNSATTEGPGALTLCTDSFLWKSIYCQRLFNLFHTGVNSNKTLADIFLIKHFCSLLGTNKILLIRSLPTWKTEGLRRAFQTNQAVQLSL